MAVLKLPVEPRELAISLDRRRSIQESAFTGAVQTVVSAGSVWRGYIDLPPIISHHTWNLCKDVIAKVMSGSDRLFVPVIEGDFDFANVFIGTYPFTEEQFCALDIRATLNKAGTMAILSEPPHTQLNGGVSPAHWDEDTLFLEGATITLMWYTPNTADTAATLDRSALTRATLREHATLINQSALTDEDRTAISSITSQGVNFPPRLMWVDGAAVGTSLDHKPPGPSTVAAPNETLDLVTLDPPVPHMFRTDTATANGEWCAVQANFCRPHLPAVILNEDAVGHTIRDRAVEPNRIEFSSSSIW